MSSLANKTHYGSGWDLGFLPLYANDTSVIPVLTATNTIAETATIDALARQPFSLLQEFTFGIDFEDEEETRAINCWQETFLSKATKFANAGWIILQNNDLTSLNYVLGGDVVNDVISPTEEAEYWLQRLGTAIKPVCAFRFVSCPYQVNDATLPRRRDIIYIADAVIDGGIEDAYRSGTESFEGITFQMKSTSKTFQKVIKKGATEADV